MRAQPGTGGSQRAETQKGNPDEADAKAGNSERTALKTGNPERTAAKTGNPNGLATDDARLPDEPSDLPRGSWGGVLKRTLHEFKDDGLNDWAAALTYYGVLAVFPALIVLVSILGVVGSSATQPLLDNLGKVAPGPARDIFTSAIRDLQHHRGSAGILLVVGILGALWSASGYIAAFMRASNSIWDVKEGRPVWAKIPVRLGVTVATMIMLAVTAIAVVFTGGLARQAGSLIGVGASAVTVWDIAKWPVLLFVVSMMLAILYYAAPNVRQPGFRWVTPGGIVAVLLWVLASAAFAFYVANFASYDKTYGSLGGVIAFLVWVWITNLVILLGAELNAEMERGRQIAAGQPADREPFLPPRTDPGKD